MKVVFDTNVLVAAFLTEGVCSKLLSRARRRECSLILSTDIIGEFHEVLLRKFSLSHTEISDVRKLLAETTTEICQDVDRIEPVRRDPEDNKILACALKAGADFLVTGDKDLLVIKQYACAKIITPRDFENLFTD